MATIALVATLTTFYFVRQTPTTQIGNEGIAKFTPASKVEPSRSSGTATQPVIQPAMPQAIAVASPGFDWSCQTNEKYWREAKRTN